MAWDFSTEPEFEAKLEWMRGFVRDEIIPLEGLDEHWRTDQDAFKRATAPLKERGEARRACGPHTSRPSSVAAGSAR